MNYPLIGVIVHIPKGTLTVMQAHKHKVVREVRTFLFQLKRTCSASEGWEEIICCAETLDRLVSGWRWGRSRQR